MHRSHIALLSLLATWLSACSLIDMQRGFVVRRLLRQGFSEEQIRLGEASVHYWRGGHGPVILLLHGFGGDGLWAWESLARELAPTHTVVIPDLLFFGRSTAHASPTLDLQSHAFLDLLAQERADTAQVVGISYGGFVAFQMSQDAPDRVAQLVMVDSPGPVYDAADHQQMLERLGVGAVEDLFVVEDPLALASLFEAVLYEPTHTPDFVLRDIHESLFSGFHDEQRSLLRDLESRQGSTSQWMVPLRCSVVWGREDQIFPLELGERLAEAFGASLHVIDHAAHVPMTDSEDTFNQVMLSLLVE